jgi:hypothetical protein
MLFQFSIQMTELLCGGFPGQSDFFPMGRKSSERRYMPNMRMALVARIRDRPARDSTFMCLNPGRADKDLLLSKKDIGSVSFLYRHDRSL